MAPTALLRSGGTTQSFCPVTRSRARSQPKRALPSGTSLRQPPSHGNTRRASLRCFISLKSQDCVSGRSRRSGFGLNGTGGFSSRHVLVASVEGNIALEKTPSESIEHEESVEAKAAEPAATPPVHGAKARTKERFKPRVPGQKARREDPTVPNEALVTGAQFTGTVTTIQPFGAFVNFGAFTDGLVHISKLSTGYVNNVSDFVALGQEVKVTILNVEQTSGRIALSMVDKEEQEAKEAATRTAESKGGERSPLQQGPDGRPVNRGRIAGGRRQSNTKRDEPKKPPTKLVRGQEVEGTVKNRIRSGLFVELPENEEGFLRFSDILGGENMAPETSPQSGEKIKATVLKIDRGKISLTTKQNLDITSVNRDINKDNDGSATNPFEIAFRVFNLIPKEAGLPEEDVVEESSVSQAPPVVEEDANVSEATSATTGEGGVDPPADENPVPEAPALATKTNSPAERGVDVKALASPEEVVAEATAIAVEEETVTEMAAEGRALETLATEEEGSVPEEKADAGFIREVTAATKAVEGVEEVIPETTAAVDKILLAEEDNTLEAEAAKDQFPKPVEGLTEEVVSNFIPEVAAAVEKASVMDEAVPKTVPDELCTFKEAFPVPISRIVSAVEEALPGEDDTDFGESAAEEVSPAAEVISEAPPADDVITAGKSAVEKPSAVVEGVIPDAPTADNVFAADKSAAAEEAISVSSADDLTAAGESAMEDASAVAKEVIPDAPATTEVAAAGMSAIGNDIAAAARVVPESPASAGEVVSTVQSETGVAGPQLSTALQAEKGVPVDTKAATGMSAAIVKQLRDETGAGMMDCKRALVDAGGDIEKARESLRKKGLASADKKASRVAAEGLIGSYIHDSRVGVLVEVNCETDFVSRGPAFKHLVQDVGMQVVASQGVQFVSVDDVPSEYVSKEKAMEAERDDLANKPDAIRAKIVEGRVSKRLNEIALLEQPYIRDDKLLVRDLVKQTVAVLGENIKVRRFKRYVLGEGLQKKSTEFAAEGGAQAVVKDPLEAPKAAEAAPPSASAPEPTNTVAVSASLVKELRDQTGAGMMECKKALKTTENDFQKAVDFLRKNGLASVHKKASRLASEGLIGSYIHDGRIGILIEVNCETDFVARGDKFKGLVQDLAMQAAAYPLVQFVNVSDVPAEVRGKEREMEMVKEDLASKPEAIRGKIVDGRVAKRMSELALLEQPFIRNDKKLVKDILTETVATLGENIQVRRFTRFNLGEGIEKKIVDFAAEVAAQAGLKA